MVFLWIILYGTLHTVAGTPDLLWLKPGAMAVYLGLLLLWLWRTKRWQAVGLNMPRDISPSVWGAMVPMLALPLYNLLVTQSYTPSIGDICLLVSVSVVEEIFFRGFLLGYLKKYGILTAILLSSVAFAGLHGINYLQQPDWVYTLMQLLCALAVGVCYSGIVWESKSLLPSCALHILTNVTAAGTQKFSLAGLCLCLAVYTSCGIWLCHRSVKKYKEIGL